MVENIYLIALWAEAIVAFCGIIYLIAHIIKSTRRHRIQMAEIHRQQSRVKAAYDLHRYVLNIYGYEQLKNLPSPDEIIEDTKPITVFNYLNI